MYIFLKNCFLSQSQKESKTSKITKKDILYIVFTSNNAFPSKIMPIRKVFSRVETSAFWTSSRLTGSSQSNSRNFKAARRNKKNRKRVLWQADYLVLDTQ